MHKLASPTILAEISTSLGDADMMIRNSTAALADAIAAASREAPLVVTDLLVEDSARHPGSRFADVCAVISGIAVAAIMHIQDDGYQPVMYARLSSESMVGTERAMVLEENETPAVRQLLDLVDFEYGAGVVRLGDGPLRHITGYTARLDGPSQKLHLSDIVIDLAEDELVVVPNEDETFHMPTRFTLNGTPLEFAIDTCFPDGDLCASVKEIEGLLERLTDGTSASLLVDVDGKERMLSAADIVVTRQPKLADVLGLDRTTLSAPVVEFIREYETSLAQDPDTDADYIDFEAGAIIHADLGGHYQFDRDGREGLLNLRREDGTLRFRGMDLQGRMISIQEIPARTARLAA